MTAAWAYLMRTGTLIRSRIAAWLRRYGGRGWGLGHM